MYGSLLTATSTFFFSPFSTRTVLFLCHTIHTFKFSTLRFTHDSVVSSNTLPVYYSTVLVRFLGMSACNHILIENFYSRNSPLL